jgi:hypothetical protein
MSNMVHLEVFWFEESSLWPNPTTVALLYLPSFGVWGFRRFFSISHHYGPHTGCVFTSSNIYTLLFPKVIKINICTYVCHF